MLLADDLAVKQQAVNTFNLRNFSRRSSDSKKTIKSPIAGQEIYEVLSVESRRPL